MTTFEFTTEYDAELIGEIWNGTWQATDVNYRQSGKSWDVTDLHEWEHDGRYRLELGDGFRLYERMNDGWVEIEPIKEVWPGTFKPGGTWEDFAEAFLDEPEWTEDDIRSAHEDSLYHAWKEDGGEGGGE